MAWRDSSTQEVERSLFYTMDMTDPHVRLQYRLGTGEFVEYRVDLVSTSPHYGGQRWWFLCPCPCGRSGGRDCYRRVRKLYLVPGHQYFICRRCGDLCYASQSEDDAHRLLSKAQTIRVRLGGSAAMHGAFPPKPKHMRWKTYRSLRAESDQLWVESLKAALRLTVTGATEGASL